MKGGSYNMKRLTMVMRCGDPKAPAEAMHYTLIGDDYSFVHMSGVEVAKAIMGKKAEFTNMGVKDNQLVSTNGSIKNYNLVDNTGNLASEPRAVILNRVENEKGLLGYTIYNLNGVLQEVRVAEAAELAKFGKIANGKIRHTQQGDIVASISGMYPLRTIKMEEATDKTITADLMFIGSAINSKLSAKYAGIIINGNNAASLSKIYDGLAKANRQVVEKVSEIGGAKASEALTLKRTGTAGFYGVYPIDTAFDIVGKANNTVSLPLEKLIIACTDYSDGEVCESSIELSKALKPLGKNTGSDKADKALRGYAEKVLEKVQKITIK